MMLLLVGASYRTAPVDVREHLALGPDRLPPALASLAARFQCESVVVSTCNRMEVYLARVEGEAPLTLELITEHLAALHEKSSEWLRPLLYHAIGPKAVHHLFRVVGSLDSMVLGEGQIAGQIKSAYDVAQQAGTVGPVLHALFQHARVVAKRVRTETRISDGKVSVSSLAIDYLTQVFDHFADKTVLVIGAGKMGELTLRQLRNLNPGRILVTNRSPEKAAQVAASCQGLPVAWEELDKALAKADVILSTTGAPEPIVTRERFANVLPHRDGRPVAIVDIAVPRDFEAEIATLPGVDLLVNVDDLDAIRERVLRSRMKHLPAAEAIVQAEQDRFLKEWSRRRTGPAIAKLSKDWDAIREQVQAQCFGKLNGKLSVEDQALIEGAFRLLQNKFLHAPISVLREEAHQETGWRLLDAIHKLFKLGE